MLAARMKTRREIDKEILRMRRMDWIQKTKDESLTDVDRI